MDKNKLDNLRLEYNSLVDRHNKGRKFLDDPLTPIADIEKWLPEFQKILSYIDTLIIKFRQEGYTMTAVEVTEGFRITEK